MSNRPSLAAEELNLRLGPWLAGHIAGARDIEIRDLIEPKQGMSSETLLFKAVWRDAHGPRQRDLVARIQRPTLCPMLADVFFQHDIMQAIRMHGSASVPSIAFAERGGAVLGQPFFLMDRVAGRVPTDFPPYQAEGWVFDLDAADRERLWWNGIQEMAKLHAISADTFPFMTSQCAEAPGSTFYLHQFIIRWFDWARQGQSFPAISDAIDYLLAHVPAGECVGLVWNDARMGNSMFADDLSVAALFDFEVASLGPAEIDLAWWLYCEDLFSVQFGIERLAGIPEEMVARVGFERLYGRAMPEFDYYLAIAALKHAILAIRDYGNGKTIASPDALPGFATDRLAFYLDRHRKVLR